MRDRNVEFPNRFRLVKVEGTDDVYDLEAAPGEVVEEGTLLNKANLLTDETAALLGMEQENPTVNEAFEQLNRNVIEKPTFQKIASYETAGSYQWTAPDLAEGKAYRIGVLIIGGGGSGGLTVYSTSSIRRGFGGSSGYSETVVMNVLPGETKSLVVGAGGKKVTSSSAGNAGGTSSFSGATANGGLGGTIDKDDTVIAGGAPASRNGSCYGVQKLDEYESYGAPTQRINLFENKPMLGGGGTAYTSSSGTGSAGTGGKDPITGLGGGAAAVSTSGTAYAKDATEPGCGGGGAIRKDGSSGSSGAGADGAVYVYFLGVADE